MCLSLPPAGIQTKATSELIHLELKPAKNYLDPVGDPADEQDGRQRTFCNAYHFSR